MALALAGICLLGIVVGKKVLNSPSSAGTSEVTTAGETVETDYEKADIQSDAKTMPVYGNWHSFTTEDGLPSNKVYTVRIDGERVLVGTHDGLAVYEAGKWQTYTKRRTGA